MGDRRIIYDIKDLKKHIFEKYNLTPIREGVSVNGDPFIVYYKVVKRWFRRPLKHEFYIEMYKGLIGIVYTERIGYNFNRDWVYIAESIEEFDERVKKDVEKFR